MFRINSADWVRRLLGVLALTLPLAGRETRAAIRDGGIDPSNLGKGDWIYILADAITGSGSSVTNLASLMAYEKNQGLQYLIIKSTDGSHKFPSDAAPQFTSDVVNAGHNAGLKIFAYDFSYGTNIAAEISMAQYSLSQGPDGLVFDAEGVWEGVANNVSVATNLVGCVRTNAPNKFLAYSTFAYYSVHQSFPYKGFGFYCDAGMPQDYWIEFGDTPTNSVVKMDNDWKNWQNQCTGVWTNAIKPIVPTGQAWNGSGTVTAAQITQFVGALKGLANPATKGGYKGVNYFRVGIHPTDVQDAIRTNTIGPVPTSAPMIDNVSAGGFTSNSAAITWTTDQASDSAVECGLTTTYNKFYTNSASLWYHTVVVTNLTVNTTYHYRVKSRNANGQGVSTDYTFTTVSDVIVESYQAGGALTPNPPYSDSGFLGPSGAKSTVGGLSATSSRYATGGSGTPSCTFKPTLAIPSAGYDLYLTHGSVNASSDLVATVTTSNGSGLPATTAGFGSPGANNWAYVGRLTLNYGASVPTVSFTYASGSLSGSARMYSDAVRFVYAAPPPTPPAITTQPQSLTVNQGDTAPFSVLAEGTAPLAYQWRFYGTNLEQATASSFARVGAQPADAGPYTVVITNVAGAVTSSVATLSVIVPPAITNQPRGVVTNAGGTASFWVGATGTSPLSYQWYFGEVAISNATDSALTLDAVCTNDAGAYWVTVSNAAGVVTSDDAVLIVNEPPAITEQPQARTNNAGTDAAFTVLAAGTMPLGYQWRFNGADIADATGSAYTRSAVQPPDGGDYCVVVTNVAGALTSAPATLTVVVPGNPPHIDSIELLADQTVELTLTGGPGNFAIDAGADLENWSNLASLTATTAVFQYIDAETNQSSRYYRVRLVP